MTMKSPEFFRDEYLPMLYRTVSYVQTARALGIDVSSVYVWLRESKAAMKRGDDPSDFLFEFQGEGPRYFHQWAKQANSACISDIEANARMRARDGYYRVCRFQGRTVYQIDPDLEELGFDGPEAYRRDPVTRQPLPEMEWIPPSTDLVIAILQAKSESYKRRSSVDVNMNGRVSLGVTTVGGPPQRAQIAAPLPMVEIVQRAEPEPNLTTTGTDGNDGPDAPAPAQTEPIRDASPGMIQFAPGPNPAIKPRETRVKSNLEIALERELAARERGQQ